MAFKNFIKVTLVIVTCLAGLCLISAPSLAVNEVIPIKCPPGSVWEGHESELDAAGKLKITSVAQCNMPLTQTENTLMSTIQSIINVIVGVLGIVTVAVIILGGITYVTSQGEAAKTVKARNTILYGVIGLVVAMLAFAVVNFVLVNVF